jgi:6-phosphogluconolactonase
MSPFPALLLVLCLSSNLASAKESLVYIAGGGTAPKTQGIYATTLDHEKGSLAAPRLIAPLKKPAYLALSPDGRFLYVAGETDLGGSVTAYERMPDGTLRFLNEQHSGGKTACHISVDKTGRFVMVANYSSANIAIFGVKPDGSLGEATERKEMIASSHDPEEEAVSKPHSIGVDPENRHVYIGDLGSDRVHIFPFDAKNGTLGEASGRNTPIGAGPRHFVFHPNGKFFYTCNEMGINVTAFVRNPETGDLSLLETIRTIPDYVTPKGVTTAEIHWHPNGKWGYVSNRGFGAISIFEAKDDGNLVRVDVVPAYVTSPWSFAIHESGKSMAIAGYHDDRVVIQSIDPASGRLDITQATIEVEKPKCVIFVPNKLADTAASKAK